MNSVQQSSGPLAWNTTTKVAVGIGALVTLTLLTSGIALKIIETSSSTVSTALFASGGVAGGLTFLYAMMLKCCGSSKNDSSHSTKWRATVSDFNSRPVQEEDETQQRLTSEDVAKMRQNRQDIREKYNVKGGLDSSGKRKVEKKRTDSSDKTEKSERRSSSGEKDKKTGIFGIKNPFSSNSKEDKKTKSSEAPVDVKSSSQPQSSKGTYGKSTALQRDLEQDKATGSQGRKGVLKLTKSAATESGRKKLVTEFKGLWEAAKNKYPTNKFWDKEELLLVLKTNDKVFYAFVKMFVKTEFTFPIETWKMDQLFKAAEESVNEE